jgi:YidC/Oxa1 family membrane protein insertase
VNPGQALGDFFYWTFQFPIQWLLEHLHSFFAHGPGVQIGAFGLAVILTTLCIRVLLYPLFTWQLKTSRRIQAEQRMIAPQLQEIRKKYKKDPQKQNAEMMKLYKEHNINPLSQLSGCLPILVQWPIIGALYRAITSVTHNLHNDLGFLWIKDVSKTALQTCCQTGTGAHVVTNYGDALLHPTVLILPLFAAAATVVQSKMMMPPMRPDMSDQERQAANMSKQMTYFMPIMVFVFGMIFPAGIALYWVTQSTFMIVQQFVVVGWGGLKVPAWFPGSGRVTPLSFPQAAPVPAAALVSGGGGGSTGPNGRARSGAVKGEVRAKQKPGQTGGAQQSRTGGGSRRNKRSR